MVFHDLYRLLSGRETYRVVSSLVDISLVVSCTFTISLDNELDCYLYTANGSFFFGCLLDDNDLGSAYKSYAWSTDLRLARLLDAQ